jgi:hypothetical protein
MGGLIVSGATVTLEARLRQPDRFDSSALAAELRLVDAPVFPSDRLFSKVSAPWHPACRLRRDVRLPREFSPGIA